MLPISIIDQSVEVLGRDKDDVAALAAIPAVRPAELDELFAAKAHRAPPAVTALQVNLALIEELHLHKTKREQLGRSPSDSLPFRGTAIRQPQPAAVREAPPKHRSVRPAQYET